MRRLSILALLLLIGKIGDCQTENALVPLPASVNWGTKKYELPKDPVIEALSIEDENIAQFLVDYLGAKKIAATFEGKSKRKKSITLTRILPDSLLPSAYYQLTIDEKGVNITAPESVGLFYGMQTLIQLIPAKGEKIELPYVSITDYPRFSYRGLHLDVSRHLFSVKEIKKFIDLLAHHKMNRFHWHLTDDQGWRIQIKKYPKLQEVAAFRDQTLMGHLNDKPPKFDGKKYGGFYTQEEIKEVVKYAAARFVTIVPEIEMPGHALAALSAHPELGCTGGPYQSATKWGVFDDVFCAGKEETFTFLQNVLDEVMALFPGQYIHIGGDECPKERWKKCPNCQARLKTEGLKDEHQLQSYFITRIEKYVNSKGKRIIGWDEILEGGLAPNATVMSWRGEEGGIAAAKQKHEVIMTPGNWCYFDHYQSADTKAEPLAIGGLTTVEEVYSYEPTPIALSLEESKFILGAQGNVWTEYIPSDTKLEYMAFPRAWALAEVVWSPKEKRSYGDFKVRLANHLHTIDHWNVNFAKHIFDKK